MKTINYWTAVLSIVGKGCILLASVAALLPSSAKAQCSQWDASGKWRIVQGTGTYVNVQLTQTGSTVTGSAAYKTKDTPGSGVQGSVDGTIQGNKFTLTAYWGDNVIGVYSGEISDQGRVEGVTYDKRTPSIRASWYSESRLKCASQSAATTTAPTKPVKITGKHSIPTPAPTTKPVKITGKHSIPTTAETPLASPTPTATESAEAAAESSSSDTEDQPKKHKKKKKHHHHDDDESQSND